MYIRDPDSNPNLSSPTHRCPDRGPFANCSSCPYIDAKSDYGLALQPDTCSYLCTGANGHLRARARAYFHSRTSGVLL